MINFIIILLFVCKWDFIDFELGGLELLYVQRELMIQRTRSCLIESFMVKMKVSI